MSEETLLDRLRPKLEEYVMSRPAVPVDEVAPVQAGQIRRLDPLPGIGGEPMLVLTVTDPTLNDLPDDITWNPGPCRIVHAVMLYSPWHLATERDVIIPMSAAGLPFQVAAVTDSLTTIRLPVDSDGDEERFGPMLGTRLPDPLLDALWAGHMYGTEELQCRVRDAVGWECGSLRPQPGDHAWYRGCRAVRNLGYLTGW